MELSEDGIPVDTASNLYFDVTFEVPGQRQMEENVQPLRNPEYAEAYRHQLSISDCQPLANLKHLRRHPDRPLTLHRLPPVLYVMQ